MRMAYLVGQYPAISLTFVLREIRQLRLQGFDLHVISIRDPDRPPDELTADEREEAASAYYVKAIGPLRALTVHLSIFKSRPADYLQGLIYALRLGRFRPGKTLFQLFYFIEAVIVGHWMEQKELLHVHVHFSSTVGLILRRIFPITMSISIHSPVEMGDPADFRLAEKVAVSVFISAISAYTREQVLQACGPGGSEKVDLAFLGIDPSVFAPRRAREAPAPFEVLCVGRLVPVKAHGTLIASLHRLVKEGRDVRLRLVGGGPDRKQLERDVAARGLRRHVIFEGALSQEGVLECYREADVFALASSAEGLPVVLMEAMAMEIPCVATRIAGIPELIRDGQDGLLVEPGDDEGLARAIARLMDDPALRRRLGEAGRHRVVERHDLGRTTAHLASIFRRRLTEPT